VSKWKASVVTASLIEQLRDRRTQAREAADQVLTRAADESRDLTSEELSEHSVHVRDEREASDAIEQETAKQVAEIRASAARRSGPVLTRESAEIARAFRSAIYARNPSPIEFGTSLDQEWPEDFPEVVHGRTGKVKVHERVTTKPTGGMGTDVYSQIVEHMVETSAVMNAGATTVTTETGEDLVIPRSTGFVTAQIVGEAASGGIPASDPALSTVTLGAFKYGVYFELSYELANDTPTNLIDYLTRAAAQALALGTTGYGNHLINGSGSGQPRGLLLDAATGVTGPAGTGTSLGAQGTANQGTDALWNLVGSVAEPYAAAPRAGFLLKNASDIIVRKLKDTTGQPVQGLTERGRILGYPSFLDAFMPTMANAVESIAFGDFSKYFIRMVNGVRFERSDEYKFKEDLVAFKCTVRLDAALIDLGAIRTFVNTT
jgi:HK97 family phage major capsid protein